MPFYVTENEWRAAVYLDDKQSREHLLAIARSIDSRYKTLTQTLTHLTSLLTNPVSSNATYPASSDVSSQPKVASTPRSETTSSLITHTSDLQHRLLAYLSGDFALPRSYTLLTLILYLSLLFLLL